MLPAVLALAGCSVVLDPGQVQCNATADCTARGFMDATCESNVCVKAVAVDPLWGCVGHVTAPTPDPSKKITITEQLIRAATGSPVTNVTCDVCDKLDYGCTGTNPDFPKGLHPDKNGNVTAAVPQGFDGFVRVLGPTTLNSLIFIGQPLITPPSVKVIQLLEPTDYTTIAAVAHLKVDMTRGTTILEGVDCQGNPQAGISFKINVGDSETVPFYLIDFLPQEPPMATSTDSEGYGGFFNMPVGGWVAKAFRASNQECIGESSFRIEADTISYVLVAPSPSCS
jgi:hypothetical protein